MDDDDLYDDDTGISNKDWLEIEAAHDLLLEIKQQLCGRDNKDDHDNEDTTVSNSGGAFAADCDDDNDDGDKNNNDHEKTDQQVQVQHEKTGIRKDYQQQCNSVWKECEEQQ